LNEYPWRVPEVGICFAKKVKPGDRSSLKCGACPETILTSPAHLPGGLIRTETETIKRAALPGSYANGFQVGHNAFKFVLYGIQKRTGPGEAKACQEKHGQTQQFQRSACGCRERASRYGQKQLAGFLAGHREKGSARLAEFQALPPATIEEQTAVLAANL
jgi:hypothetical protein